MKLTRTEIDKRLRDSEGNYTTAAVQMLEDQAAEYQPLVDAAVYHVKSTGMKGTPLALALQPHLPPPSPADRLDALVKSANYENFAATLEGVEAIATELRESEG